jgi:hypothetical protein
MVFYEQFKSKGYIKRIDLVNISDEEYTSMLFKLFSEDLKTFSNCGKQVQHLISLHRLSLSDVLIDLIKQLGIIEPVISTRPVLFFNHPKLALDRVYHTVDSHQDWRSMQGSLNSVVIWVPLIDINCDLGALKILPGSHLSGLKADNMNKGFGFVELSEEEISKFMTVEVKVGDILVFSSFLIHASGNNISNTPRWSCHFRYNDLHETTFIERGYPHAYIYHPVEHLITPNFPGQKLINKVFKIK